MYTTLKSKLNFQLSSSKYLRSYKLGLVFFAIAGVVSILEIPDIWKRFQSYRETGQAIERGEQPKLDPALLQSSYGKSLEEAIESTIQNGKEIADSLILNLIDTPANRIIRFYKEAQKIEHKHSTPNMYLDIG